MVLEGVIMGHWISHTFTGEIEREHWEGMG